MRALVGLIVAVLCLVGCGSDDGDDTEAAATFEGADCAYDGPAEFALDSTVTFTVVNATSDEVGFGVVKVPDGTTVDQIAESGIFVVAEGGDSAFRGGVDAPAIEDTEYEIVVGLDVPGSWVLNCYVLDGTPEGTDYPATVFTVTGG